MNRTYTIDANNVAKDKLKGTNYKPSCYRPLAIFGTVNEHSKFAIVPNSVFHGWRKSEVEAMEGNQRFDDIKGCFVTDMAKVDDSIAKLCKWCERFYVFNTLEDIDEYVNGVKSKVIPYVDPSKGDELF